MGMALQEILSEALRRNGTDIHLGAGLRPMLRVDGDLVTMSGFDTSSNEDIRAVIGEVLTRKQIEDFEENFEIDFSFSYTGSAEETSRFRGNCFYERGNLCVALRTIPTKIKTIKDLKLPGPIVEVTKKHRGLFLVTGPTGSGKTTTLYAALNRLNSLDRKILTIEDPIEYQLKGITQMQVQPKIGFDFGMGLRAMLRHDPDIMLVGEIRDYETAEMAIRSSLTGHLVLSTLHTNDAAGAVTRLIDMGVEPFLISSTMIASIAQRLLRRVCAACARPDPPEERVLHDEFGVDLSAYQSVNFQKGIGCDQCRHTGYRGRIASYEMLPFSAAVKDLTVQRANALQIKRKALEEGMVTLRQSGWRRVCEGMSTIEEVLRVTADAEVMGAPSETGDAAISI